MNSKSGEMTTMDWRKWRRNLLRFTLPPIALYIGSIVYIVQLPGHIVSFNDFIPSNLVIGGWIVYFGSSLQDLITKYQSETKDA